MSIGTGMSLRTEKAKWQSNWDHSSRGLCLREHILVFLREAAAPEVSPTQTAFAWTPAHCEDLCSAPLSPEASASQTSVQERKTVMFLKNYEIALII